MAEIEVTSLAIPDVKRITLPKFGDDRGFFMERFNAEAFAGAGLPTSFVQDNHSRSAPGVVRGLHYQHTPAQGKLVGVTRGSIVDVAVDIRASSPTYGQHVVEVLDDATLLWVPAGFAHGFAVVGDDLADVFYKVDAMYNPEGEGGIAWNDPELNINWQLGSLTPQVSARDEQQPSFAEYRAAPAF